MEETFTVSVTTNDKTEEDKYKIQKESDCLKSVIVSIVCVFLCYLLNMPILNYTKRFIKYFGKDLCILFVFLAICLIIIVIKQLLTYNIKKEKIAFLKELYYASKTDNLTNCEKDIINSIASAVQEL